MLVTTRGYPPAHLLVFFAEELQVSQIQDPCKDLEGLGQLPHHELIAKLGVRSQYCQQSGNWKVQLWVVKFRQTKTRKLSEMTRNHVPKTLCCPGPAVWYRAYGPVDNPQQPASAPLQEIQAN